MSRSQSPPSTRSTSLIQTPVPTSSPSSPPSNSAFSHPVSPSPITSPLSTSSSELHDAAETDDVAMGLLAAGMQIADLDSARTRRGRMRSGSVSDITNIDSDVVSDSPVLEYIHVQSPRLSSMQPSTSPPIRISVSRTSTTVTSDMPASVADDSPSLPSVAISSSTPTAPSEPASLSGEGADEGARVDQTEHDNSTPPRNPTPTPVPTQDPDATYTIENLTRPSIVLPPPSHINIFAASEPLSLPIHPIISNDEIHVAPPATSSGSSEGKTPNVYINGLPPHFPEDQLFALTRPFGAVRSVRSFTRHVGERESGYGFVLFESVDSAEKCIDSLRRYRNLHPSFSKQVHKIPGTATIIPSPSLSAQSTTSSQAEDQRGWSQSGSEEGDATFKAKMERLQDETSTNLYIEGLPLSIDEPTLGALVSPYTIKSSRLFQTKLSHPPRIIAFVRLETRSAAEEIIERLHGRMVRGWNDAGSRISVRFADTSEQRELRRTERTVREGESSPARLSIAQAALLSLHGPELRTQAPLRVDTSVLDARRGQYGDFSSNAPISPVDFGGQMHPSPTYQPYTPLPIVDNRSMFDSLRHGGIPFTGYNASPQVDRRAYPVAHHHAFQQSDPRILGDMNLNVRYSNPIHGMQGQVQQAQAHNGFTPAEELILRGHSSIRQLQQRSHRNAASDRASLRASSLTVDPNANINVGVRGRHTQASVLSFPPSHHVSSPPSHSQTLHSPMAPIYALPSEEEFHSSPTTSQYDNYQPQQQQQQFNDGNRNATTTTTQHNHNIHPAHVNARLSRDFDSQQQQQQQASPSLSYSGHNYNHNQHAHTRSTTLPHRSTTSSANQHQRHPQHSSMSIPNSNSTSRMNQHKNIPSIIHTNTNHCNGNSADNVISNSIMRHNGDKTQNQNPSTSYDSRPYQDIAVYDVERTSPSLVSPSLTYSSHTPATLSPATPFFGSFDHMHPGDGYEGQSNVSSKLRSGGVS